MTNKRAKAEEIGADAITGVVSSGKAGGLVAGEGGVDGAGPGVNASGEGLDVLEALVAEPHGDAERTCPVVAEDDYLLIWIEFRVGAGGDLAHGHEERVGEGGGLVLPGLAYVQ
jgi:hypothetical protein